MKKIMNALISLFLTIVLLGTFGCERREDSPTVDNDWCKNGTYIYQGYTTKDGYYYIGAEPTSGQSLLYYFDVNSKTSVVLCDKIGCAHNSKDCHAYLPISTAVLFIANEKLFTIESEGDSVAKLIQRDLDGSNREEKFTFLEDKMTENSSVVVNDTMIYGNSLYYTASIYTHLEDAEVGEEMIKEEKVARKLDLVTLEELDFYALDPNKSFVMVAVNENQVLFQEYNNIELDSQEALDLEFYSSQKYLSQINIQVRLLDTRDASVNTLAEASAWELTEPLGVYKDNLYLNYWDEKHENNVVKRLNIKSGESEEVLKINGTIDLSILLNDSRMFLKESGGWKLYCLEDFSQIPLDFLGEDIWFRQFTPDGDVILERILEKTKEEGSSYLVKKSAYSFISKEDFDKGNPDFIDFYFQEYR